MQLKKRLNHGFQMQGSYTWSKSIDDATAGPGNTNYPTEGSSSQMWGTKADRGLGALNQKHNLTMNGIWTLPAPRGSRLASSVLGGWELSGIFTAVAGTPFTATETGTNVQDNGKVGGSSRLRMPDWTGKGAFSSIIHSRNPDQYFDTSNFVVPPTGIYGNLGRGTFIGPGVVNVDITLGKSIPLGLKEGTRLDFRSDFFNLFNRANFADPLSAVLNGSNGAPIGTAGKITRTVTSSRQLQFSLKLVF